MKNYRFVWEDGETSYESFKSPEELSDYIQAMEEDHSYPPLVNYTEE